MIRRIGRVYLVELAKATRRRFTPAGLVLVIAVVLCLPLAKPITHGNPSAYAFIAYATPLALNLVGLLLLVIFSSNLFASELAGSIWLALVRPIHRTDVLLAKLALGMTYAFVMTAVVAATSWGLAYAFGDLKGVAFGGEMLFTQADMAACYAYGFLLTLLPQCAAVAYAILVSLCVRSAPTAVGASVGIWLLLDVVKHPLRIAPYVFTSYAETPWKAFLLRCDGIDASWWPDSGRAIAASLISTVIFTFLSALVLARRDIRA